MKTGNYFRLITITVGEALNQYSTPIENNGKPFQESSAIFYRDRNILRRFHVCYDYTNFYSERGGY